METINSTHDINTDGTEPVHEAADEEDLLCLFDQFSDLMLPSLVWLSTDNAVIINEASIEGSSVTYHVTVQQCTMALFYTSINMLVISQKFFNYLPQKLKIAEIKQMHSNISQCH